jgi:hypothetical protein
MRRPFMTTLYALNVLNYLSTELYLRTTGRHASPYVKSCHRDISADIRALRISMRHTDPYNAHLREPTYNVFTLQSLRDHLRAFLSQ